MCDDLTDELVAVAADGVKGEGEPHADDGAQEEAHEDHLLLNIDLHRRPDWNHQHLDFFSKRSEYQNPYGNLCIRCPLHIHSCRFGQIYYGSDLSIFYGSELL